MALQRPNIPLRSDIVEFYMKMSLREVSSVSEGAGGTKTHQNSVDDSSISHSVVAKLHFLFSQHFYVNFLVLSNRWEMNRLTTRL